MVNNYNILVFAEVSSVKTPTHLLTATFLAHAWYPDATPDLIPLSNMTPSTWPRGFNWAAGRAHQAP